MNITDYLNEFERLYHEIQRFEMSLPSAVLIKSESSYLAETKSEHLHCTVIVFTVIGVDSIIDRVITIAIGVSDRVNTITAIMEQIHQYQSIGITGDVKLIL